MTPMKQPWLPKVGKVAKVEKQRKDPQPRNIRSGRVKKFELRYRPFDLRFRGRLNRWLKNLIDRGLPLERVLTEKQSAVVKTYLFPQGNRWFTQQEVAWKIKEKNVRKVRLILVEAVSKIWEKTR